MCFCWNRVTHEVPWQEPSSDAVGPGEKSDVGSQGGVELCKTLDQLLKLGPLLWI